MRAGCTVAPGTSAASAADACGSTNARPSRRADSTIASAPRTARSSPVSASSPANSWRSSAAAGDLPARGEDAERDRQVEAPRLLRQVGGREVDGDLARGKLEVRVLQRRAHAVARLAHLGLRQPDEIDARQAAGEMHLDRDRRRGEPGERAAAHDGDAQRAR